MSDFLNLHSALLHPCLASVFRAFEQKRLNWCVIRLPRHYSTHGGDIDLLVDPRDIKSIRRILREMEFIQLPHTSGGLHFIRYHQPTRQWLWLHIVTELAFGPGYILKSGAEAGCLMRRQSSEELRRLAPDDEFWVLLLHCLLDKGTVAEHHRARLLELVSVAQPAGPWATFVTSLSPAGWNPQHIMACVQQNDWAQLEQIAPSLLATWRHKNPHSLRQRILRRCQYYLQTARKLLWQRGINVALLGPDGAGKTSLAQNLENSFIFPVQSVYMGLTGGVLPYTLALGLPFLVIPARFAVFWFRYLKALTYQARGKLVIFDRYIYDAFVPHPDTLSKLQRFYRWLDGHTCPEPDLVLVLNAPGRVMHERKGEYTPEVLEDWRQHFLALQERLPRLQIIDTTRPPEEVCGDATTRIWKQYVRRWQ